MSDPFIAGSSIRAGDLVQIGADGKVYPVHDPETSRRPDRHFEDVIMLFYEKVAMPYFERLLAPDDPKEPDQPQDSWRDRPPLL